MILSIIIPVYNVEQFVEKCIRSCEDQDVLSSEYEIVVVNDGSPDNSLDIVTRLASEFDNIKVFSKVNGGLSSARNYGMEHSSGDYIMFLDSDDWIASNCLKKLTKQLIDERPDCLRICAADVIGDEYRRRTTYHNLAPRAGRDEITRKLSPCAPFTIWSSSFLHQYELKFYEGIYHEDLEFTPRAFYQAKKMSFTNDIIYYVYQNPNSITRTVNPKKAYDMVNVVAPHLYDFSKHIEPAYQPLFYDLVCIAINAAMDQALLCNKSERQDIQSLICEKKWFRHCLNNSPTRKYHLEAFMFWLFPKHQLVVYKILQTIAGHR